ncbi:BTAD domain-containing putative transcriptional regulator [Streptomyces sp. MBT53]|uniref:BTAD domain-containing putative transcriptional regulator n=1 Tax=Streptomyces sp. MBT53 TaxID=1488384 RepID=UPI0019144D0D|nr:BTAD domain-containing putative transcriptional regulator [Streptomyces sp. MBT53]MBK6014479.1 AAA family ATPase [Streptomyces sp. MBT53]
MLRLNVLGPMEAYTADRRLALGGPQQRAVLAMLIMARGSVVPAERIAEHLWPHTSPERSLAALYPLISNLRRALEPGRPPRAPAGVLVSAAPGYALRVPEEAVDAWRFEALVREARSGDPEASWHRLKEGLTWWQGLPYSEWSDRSWAADEVARLDEVRLMARELLLQVGLSAGHAAEVAVDAEVLVRDAPLREDAWRLLALSLWASGRQADALAALRRARSVLVETVGLEPGVLLTELEQDILHGRHESLHRAAPGPQRGGTGPADPTRTRIEAVDDARPVGAVPVPDHRRGVNRLPQGLEQDRHPLKGRTAELRMLREAARVASHRGAVVTLSGEAGSGKSTLLDHFGHLLRREGWIVITGRCPEEDGAPPAWAWVEALSELARISPPDVVEPLDAFLQPGGAREPLTRDAAAGRFKVHMAVREWLSAVAARQPLALFVDDLHRADTETLMLLCRAASLRAPVLVTAAFRSDEAGSRPAPFQAELARLSAYRLTLRGLDTPAVAELVREVCGTDVAPETVAALAERTGGNPFFVTESARLLAVEGTLKAVTEVPEAIRDVLRLRLANLSPAERSVIGLAAVCGREADIDVLAEASDLEPAEVYDSLEACVRAGLLTEPAPGRVRFTHVLLRDVAYTELTGLRARSLHGRLADVLERLRPNDLDALALHFRRSADPAQADRAVVHAVRAAERAERRYAYDVAVELLSGAVTAVDLVPGTSEQRAERLVDVYGRLMRAQVRTGSVGAAQATGERAVQEARGVGRDDLVAAAFAAWTEPTPWLTRRHWAVDQHVVDTLERLLNRPDLPRSVTVRLLQRLVDELAGFGTGQEAEAAERQLALARRVEDPALLAAAFTTLTKLMPHEHQLVRYGVMVSELRELVRHHELPAYQWVCEHIDSMIAAIHNDAEAVRRHGERGLSIARRFHIAGAEAASMATMAMLAHARGQFDEAEASYRRVRERLSGHNPWHGADIYTRGLITIRLNQGRVAEIEPHTREVYETWGPRGGEALALVLALQGKTDEARTVRFHRDPPKDHFYAVRLGARARLACVFEDREAAARLIPLLEPVRNQLGSAATTAFCTRPLAQALGELHAMLGDRAAAQSAFLEAEKVAGLWGADHLAATARACGQALPG